MRPSRVRGVPLRTRFACTNVHCYSHLRGIAHDNRCWSWRLPMTSNGAGVDDRTVAALTEVMSVLDSVGRVRGAPGLYLVVSSSGSEYLVDMAQGRCECPDDSHRPSVTCKHRRRVAFAIGERPIPDWANQMRLMTSSGCTSMPTQNGQSPTAVSHRPQPTIAVSFSRVAAHSQSNPMTTHERSERNARPSTFRFCKSPVGTKYSRPQTASTR